MTTELTQRSPEWFAARRGRVTGSVAGAILDLAPYMSRADVMRSMVRSHHGAESEFQGNIATEYGVNHEQEAIECFELDHGMTVVEVGFATKDDWLGASPDGLIGDDAILEVKCPFGKRKDLDPIFKTAKEQPHYYAQMQLELLCTGRKTAYFYQWTPHGNDLQMVDFDQGWLDTNLPALRAFYDEYLADLDNPEHLEPLRKEVNSQTTRLLIDEYDQLAEAIDNATERKKEVLALLVKSTNEKDGLIHGRKLTRVDSTGSISYAKIVKEKLKDLDLEPWRGKSSQHWKFS